VAFRALMIMQSKPATSIVVEGCPGHAPLTMTDADFDKVFAEYLSRFGVPLPCPACINPDHVAEVAARYLAKGRPIPKSYNWWSHVPPDAVA
jgi:hypothetical protein